MDHKILFVVIRLLSFQEIALSTTVILTPKIGIKIIYKLIKSQLNYKNNNNKDMNIKFHLTMATELQKTL